MALCSRRFCIFLARLVTRVLCGSNFFGVFFTGRSRVRGVYVFLGLLGIQHALRKAVLTFWRRCQVFEGCLCWTYLFLLVKKRRFVV